MESLASGKVAYRSWQTRLRKADDTWLWTDNSYCVKGRCFYGIFRDVSKAKQAEARAAAYRGQRVPQACAACSPSRLALRRHRCATFS
jgi:hypothetical protein